MIRKQISVGIKDGKVDYESCLDQYQIEAMFSKVYKIQGVSATRQGGVVNRRIYMDLVSKILDDYTVTSRQCH